MSLEMWSPPSGRIPVYQRAPSRKSATSVVPPPKSMSRIPSSFSSAETTASAEASGSRTRSWTCSPARSTPRLLMPRICPPATPVMTEAISTPAISSASPTACLMDSTVESMLTTTPLRRPRDGLTPTPMMSRLPTGDHSAITQQIFVVPTSSPAITWRPLALAMSPSPRRGFEHDLVAEAQVDGRHRFASGAELAQHAQQTAQPRLPVIRAKAHLDAVHGIEHRSVGPAHVDLRDLSQQGAARAQQDAEQGDSGGDPGRAASADRQFRGAEAGDHGRGGRDGPALGPQVHALLVDPAQPSRVHEGEGAALLDEHRHSVREGSDHLGAADERKRFQPCLDGAGIEPEEVHPCGQAGGGDGLTAQPVRTPNLNIGDGEARRGQRPAQAESAAGNGHGGADQQGEPDGHDARPPDEPPAQADPGDSLAGDEPPPLRQVFQLTRSAPRGQYSRAAAHEIKTRPSRGSRAPA